MVKSSLRVKFKSIITQLSDEDRKAQSSQLFQTLEKYLQDKSGVWTLFCPLSDEPNLLGLLDSCTHIEWAFPRVQSQTQMEFLKVESKDQMVCSSWGLHEPDPSTSPQIPFDKISGSIIPGMAYDLQGTRLGRGGGYYDRFLTQFSGLKVGVVFNEGLTTDLLPREDHDQLMDIVATPSQWVEVNVKEEVQNGI